ncbi:MAG: hypothetical protein II829_08125 [Bacteroidales bacterium]|nr:hypothetical protein [Bacteroidales bacterium]
MDSAFRVVFSAKTICSFAFKYQSKRYKNAKKKFYALLALLLAAGGVTMQAQTEDDFWIEVNTNGEWFHHPVGPSIDTVYAASMHGVYRSVDTCQTWQCVGFENQSVDFLYLSEDDEL